MDFSNGLLSMIVDDDDDDDTMSACPVIAHVETIAMQEDSTADTMIEHLPLPTIEPDKAPVVQNSRRSEMSLREMAVGDAAILSIYRKGFTPSCNNPRHSCRKVDKYDVLRLREGIWKENDTTYERSVNLFQVMREMAQSTSSSRRVHETEDVRRIDYKVGNLSVCQSTFCEAINMLPSSTMLRGVLVQVQSGGNKKSRSIRPNRIGIAGERAVHFINETARTDGDYPANDEVIIVPFRFKTMMYKRYVALSRDKPVEYSTFCNVWRLNCPNIVLMTDNPGFKACTTCKILTTIMDTKGIYKDVENYVDIIMDLHQAQQKGERCYYDAAMCEAKADPDLLVIVCDAMDKSKTSLFRFNTERSRCQSSVEQSFPHLEQSVIGVRAFFNLNGEEDRLTFFVLDEAISKNTNTTIECIHQTILSVLKMYEDANVTPPKRLHLQLDNGPDNKSQWVFGYVSDIVSRGIFLYAHISYMKAGHTHCNIDQNFSSVNKAFIQAAVKTIEDFMRILSSVLADELHTKVVRLQFVHNMKEFYDDFLKNDIHGHFFPHQFRFWKTETGCGCQVRMWFYCNWYPGRRLTDVPADSASSSSRVSEVVNQLAHTSYEEGALGDVSILDGIAKDTPSSFRVDNDETIKSINWLKKRPTADQKPRICRLKTPDSFKEVRKALGLLRSKPNTMFTLEQIDQVLEFLNQREIIIEQSKTAPSQWVWPVVNREANDEELANPYATLEAKYKSLDISAYNKLNPIHKQCIDVTKASLFDCRTDGVEANQRETKEEKAAAKEAAKAAKPPKAAPPAKSKSEFGLRARLVKEEMESEGDDEDYDDDDDDDFESIPSLPRKKSRRRGKDSDSDSDYDADGK